MHHALRCLFVILLSLCFINEAKSEPPAKVIPTKPKEENIFQNHDPYPRLQSKKGLQVQMVDDAIALGVKHAALNFNLGQMVALEASPNDFSWQADGRTFYFRRGYIEGLDATVKTLSDFGATVSLILLNYEGADTNLNMILMHPGYDKSCPNHLSAFNTSTPEGLAYFKAAMEFLAARYSAKGYPYGRVVNYIVGNEVNSHWYWANMGHVSMEKFADDYLLTVRACHTAVRKFSSSARVFISLEHHWNIRYAGCNETQGFAGRPFVNYFNRMAKGHGLPHIVVKNPIRFSIRKKSRYGCPRRDTSPVKLPIFNIGRVT